jgi:hypothetical protein
MTQKQLIGLLNNKFDKAHYIEKKRRSIQSLYKMLLYLSEKYKEEINQIQANLSQAKNKKVKIDYRELVACSIAAKSKKIGAFGTSYQSLNKQDCHYELLMALSSLGSLGKLSKICDNEIGRCAEVKAANNILRRDKKSKISNIEFTQAIRPRTLEKMSRCPNCVTIFGNEN